MDLDFPKFRFIAIGKNNNLPISMITFQNMRLSFIKHTNLNKEVNIFGESISVHYF